MNAELAKKLWLYDPDTGSIYWRVLARKGRRVGQSAGVINNSGYRMLTYEGKKYKASRVVWLMMTGAWPSKNIDHKNGVRHDDRWMNLREADQSENLANTRVRSNNTTGIKGVSPTKDGRFLVGICFRGRRKNLGVFASFEEAVQIRKAAERDWHGDFARQ